MRTERNGAARRGAASIKASNAFCSFIRVLIFDNDFHVYALAIALCASECSRNCAFFIKLAVQPSGEPERTERETANGKPGSIVSSAVRIFRGCTVISIQFSRSVAAALWTRRVLLPWRLIAFRRDNISALISLCGAPPTLEINLSAPVYLCSLDFRLRFILSLYLSISLSLSLSLLPTFYDAPEQGPA